MHYYKRNLGDYAKKAGRLSMLQHGSYTLLIDSCYDREQFPTLEEAYEWTWASTTEEKEAVAFVLHKFFTFENGVYVQKRIQEEIEEYHSKAQINKRIAQDRETNRRSNRTNRAQVVNEATPNHKPRTINQEPTNTAPDGFDVFWNAYPKKVGKPAALKAFKAAKLNGSLEAVLKDIASKVHSESWMKQGGQFIPNPSTYLNQRRWEDSEPEVSVTVPSKDVPMAVQVSDEHKARATPMPENLRNLLKPKQLDI